MAEPVDSVQGKLFIGLILNVMLFGINVTQTYIYYIHSKKDRLWIKFSVAIIFIADLIQPTFLSIYLYRTLIVNFGNEISSSTATDLFAAVPTMTGLTACIVQIFFAWRIRLLTNNWYYVAFVIVAALSGGACSIVAAYVGRYSPQYIEFRAFKVVAILGFVSEMLGDIMITSILVCFLNLHKSGIRESNQMVNRIICFILHTGLLMLIVTGLDLLFYLISPNGTYLLLNIITSKLYTTSLLCTLNSRRGWGYDTSENNDEGLDLTTDLGLRFASNFQSVDRTSSEVNTAISENDLQNRLEVKDLSGAHLEAVTHTSGPLSAAEVTRRSYHAM